MKFKIDKSKKLDKKNTVDGTKAIGFFILSILMLPLYVIVVLIINFNEFVNKILNKYIDLFYATNKRTREEAKKALEKKNSLIVEGEIVED